MSKAHTLNGIDVGKRAGGPEPSFAPIPNTFGQWIGVLATWLERGRQRRALLALDEHALKDIGVTRAEALQEASKPCWRA